MPALLNLVGQRFGRLLVLSRDGHASPTRWRCICDCTRMVSVFMHQLRGGKTKSCGCLQREVAASNLESHRKQPTHGMSRSPQYRWWNGILSRCLNKRNDNYPHYGGRGIKVDSRWVGKGGFENFYADICLLGPRPSGHTLDRKDNDGDYVISNLQWASAAAQRVNQRKRARIEQFTDEDIRAEYVRRRL